MALEVVLISKHFSLLLFFTLVNLSLAQRGSNPFASDQVSTGNWEASKYLKAGWSGYHISIRKTKQIPWIKYSYGDDNTRWIEQCSNGDCQFKESGVIKRIGKTGFEGHRIGVNQTLGEFESEDNGSQEQTTLKTPSGVSIFRIDEIEAKSKLGFDEAQTQTFSVFDKRGNLVELGHIEESDARNSINQPESLYKRVGGRDEFVTTVVERLRVGDEGQESMRFSTQWCNSDKYKVSKDFVKVLYNDSFDWSDCPKNQRPFISDTKNGIGASLKQFAFERSSSNVSIHNPETKEHELKYLSDSDVDKMCIDCRGTEYMIKMGEDTPIHVNGEQYESLANGDYSPTYYPDVRWSVPKAKLLTLNFKGKKDFKGHQDWTDNDLSNISMESAVALVVREVVGKIYTNLSGKQCAYKKSSGWSGVLGDPFVFTDSKIRKMYNGNASGVFTSNKTLRRDFALTCRPAYTYTINHYVLFPPTINGKSLSNYEKLVLSDQILATMPDQAQSSPELALSEKSIDMLRAFERYHHTKNPESIDFDLAVDIATEEDHSSAAVKVWDLFSDLNIVSERSNRVKESLSSIGNIQETQKKEEVSDDEIDY